MLLNWSNGMNVYFSSPGMQIHGALLGGGDPCTYNNPTPTFSGEIRDPLAVVNTLVQWTLKPNRKSVQLSYKASPILRLSFTPVSLSFVCPSHLSTCLPPHTISALRWNSSSKYQINLAVAGEQWNIASSALLQHSLSGFCPCKCERTIIYIYIKYKYGGRGFEIRWGEFLKLSNTFGRPRQWGLLSL
jgi:hypothetical protein